MSEIVRAIALRGMLASGGTMRITFDGVTADDFSQVWEALDPRLREGWQRAAAMVARGASLLQEET